MTKRCLTLSKGHSVTIPQFLQVFKKFPLLWNRKKLANNRYHIGRKKARDDALHELVPDFWNNSKFNASQREALRRKFTKNCIRMREHARKFYFRGAIINNVYNFKFLFLPLLDSPQVQPKGDEKKYRTKAYMDCHRLYDEMENFRSLDIKLLKTWLRGRVTVAAEDGGEPVPEPEPVLEPEPEIIIKSELEYAGLVDGSCAATLPLQNDDDDTGPSTAMGERAGNTAAAATIAAVVDLLPADLEVDESTIPCGQRSSGQGDDETTTKTATPNTSSEEIIGKTFYNCTFHEPVTVTINNNNNCVNHYHSV